jgi:lysophospholipase L1-like esterase
VKHPLRRALVAALAATAVVVSTVLITTSGSSAANTPLIGWAGSWSTSLVAPSPLDTGGSLSGFSDESIREIVHTSLGGNSLRIRLSNEFGTGPITIGHATIALPTDALDGSADLVAGSVHQLTFDGGSPSTTMYEGADVVSDPLHWNLPADSTLAVTIYLPTATGPASWHPSADEETFVYNGDQANNTDGSGNILTRFAFYFLAAIDVQTVLPVGTIVVLGDSISNGNGATLNNNSRWPDLLSDRIESTKSLLKEGVINQSISGNAVTVDGSQTGLSSITFGRSGASRLVTDVLSQENVRTVIIELGVNDINFYNETAPQIIEGLTQLGLRLKEHNINAVVNTISPFGGFAGPPGWSTDKEAVRQAVNTWIRTQSVFDYVIDQDQVLRDPANPTLLLPAYNSGDGIHPNDAGAQALVNSIQLSRL